MTPELTYRIMRPEELLAFVLEVTVDVAKQILDETGSLYNIPKRDDVPVRFGIPPQKIHQLAAAITLADRARLASDVRKTMTGAEMIAAHYGQLQTIPHEECWLTLLDIDRRILSQIKLSHGDETSTNPSDYFICRQAILAGASAAVVVHNHPSGSTHPSPPDILFSRRVKTMLAAVGVKLLDSIVVGGGSYTSLGEMNLLNEAAAGQTGVYTYD